MKILVINIYTYPESFSSGYYIYDLFSSITSELGHECTFISPNPTRNLTRETIKKYKGINEEEIKNIKHIRLWVNSNNGNRIVSRIFRLFLFQRKLKKYLKKHLYKYDVVYIPSNPPIFIPLMVEKIAKKNSVTVLYDINDIFPDILGKKGVIYSYLKKLSMQAIREADYLVTLSEDMKNSIVAKGVSESRVFINRIWAPSHKNEQLPISIKEKIFKSNHFNVCYFGNVGQFQNCSLLLDVAKKCNNQAIFFLIIGRGRKYSEIEKRILKEKINNAAIFPEIEEKYSRSVYEIADLNIISLERNVIFNACPSKTASCICSGKPCLVLCDESDYSKKLQTQFNFLVNSTFDSVSVVNQICDFYNDQKFDYSINKTKKTGFEREDNLKKWFALFKVIEENKHF